MVSLAQASHGQYVLAQSQATTTQLIKLGKHGKPNEVLRGAAPSTIHPNPKPSALRWVMASNACRGFYILQAKRRKMPLPR
ncbi:hypothetical protein HSBAA_31130 [Vreelandella sulfidaeris]|uniref:Uncharacterized protein n=1 Tax=Vreelandella sulfidaeris TaxID=115553 RepID=A0A455U8E0_9GAMM|nr:hypothetical protein HSBAA_31130 [Halomonas sulfidaeris]